MYPYYVYEFLFYVYIFLLFVLYSVSLCCFVCKCVIKSATGFKPNCS